MSRSLRQRHRRVISLQICYCCFFFFCFFIAFVGKAIVFASRATNPFSDYGTGINTLIRWLISSVGDAVSWLLMMSTAMFADVVATLVPQRCGSLPTTVLCNSLLVSAVILFLINVGEKRKSNGFGFAKINCNAHTCKYNYKRKQQLQQCSTHFSKQTTM